MSESEENKPPGPETESKASKPKAGWFGIVLAVILTIPNVAHSFLLSLSQSSGVDSAFKLGEAIGAAISPILIGLIVVALFQIGKKFRNNKSRVIIYNWTLFVILLSVFLQVLNATSSG